MVDSEGREVGDKVEKGEGKVDRRGGEAERKG